MTAPRVSKQTKQGTEAQAIPGVEALIWTERRVSALVNGVEGGKWYSLMDKVYAPATLALAPKASINISVSANQRKAACSWFLIPSLTSIAFASLAPDLQLNRSKKSMKTQPEPEDMLPEYDFSQGMRGKHFKAYQQGKNVIILEEDVAKVFHNSEAVNHALRLLIQLAVSEACNHSAS